MPSLTVLAITVQSLSCLQALRIDPQKDGQTSAQYHNMTDFDGCIKSPVIWTNETSPWYGLDYDGNFYDVKVQVNR